MRVLVIHGKEQRICCQYNPEAKQKWNCSVCLGLTLHTLKEIEVAHILSILSLLQVSEAWVEQWNDEEGMQAEVEVAVHWGKLTRPQSQVRSQPGKLQRIVTIPEAFYK